MEAAFADFFAGVGVFRSAAALLDACDGLAGDAFTSESLFLPAIEVDCLLLEGVACFEVVDGAFEAADCGGFLLGGLPEDGFLDVRPGDAGIAVLLLAASSGFLSLLFVDLPALGGAGMLGSVGLLLRVFFWPAVEALMAKDIFDETISSESCVCCLFKVPGAGLGCADCRGPVARRLWRATPAL